VALYTTRTTGINDTRYFHPDHLNSIDTITDELGNVVERLSYDAYGKRRQANWQDATSSIISLSNRGYTGHKHDDEVGLINMRARLYDPVLGRFVQPDTRIPGPTHSQSYNRYSYCGNNPISHMDPTGHFLKKIFKGVRRALRKVSKFAKRAWRNPYVRLAAAVAASFFTGGAAAAAWGPIAGGAAGGAAFGFVASGGNLRAAFAGAATGAAFGWVGNFDLQGFEKIGAHALTGGITSEATGGDFRSGFFGAGVAAFARTNWSIPAKVTLRAVAGGIGAELAGGKFRNGATTAAFAYLFNETLHDKFGELSYSKRRAKWEEFMEKRDEIVAGWNKPHFSSPSLSRKFRGFVKFLLKNGTAYQDWDSERFKYDLGVDSLEAHRVLSGFNERPSTFGPAWAQVRWRLYDFGGSTQDTVDFYYWANEKTRPSNCFFAWNC
jgi:RHS repeat-associated protein